MLSQGEPRDAGLNFDNYRILQSIIERLYMLNTATLSTRTYLAPKPAYNTLNHVWRSLRPRILGSQKSRWGTAY